MISTSSSENVISESYFIGWLFKGLKLGKKKSKFLKSGLKLLMYREK